MVNVCFHPKRSFVATGLNGCFRREADIDDGMHDVALDVAIYRFLNVIEMLTKITRIADFDFRPHFLAAWSFEIKTYPIAVKRTVIVQ